MLPIQAKTPPYFLTSHPGTFRTLRISSHRLNLLLLHIQPASAFTAAMIVMAQSLPIPEAKLESSKDHLLPGQLRVSELFFSVPLDYQNPGKCITLFARRVTKSEVPAVDFNPDENPDIQKPYVVYLEGGPGFGNKEPQDHPLTRAVLARGAQLLLLDHRGTGLSTPVSADMLEKIGDVNAQFEYMKLMRQDNTVRDCEAVRKLLTKGLPEHKAKWSIFGQSYGGFVSMSYLSMHPEGLREVFLTGGLAPVLRTADEVYQATFSRVAERNAGYYKKFPEDAATVHRLANYIQSQGGKIPLPGGGYLTTPRLLTIGIAFGGHGGFDTVHSIILGLQTSLDQFGMFTRAALLPLEGVTPFDTNIIYAILHEAIYVNGPGKASNWASDRVGQRHPDFSWLRPDSYIGDLKKPIYFSGENIFKFMFDSYPELMRLKELADKLAAFDQWPYLYDYKRLSKNEVPVYAASYIDDMYVENTFARETAGLVRAKAFETNVMFHNAVRAKVEEVLPQLFALRDDVID